jgi:16S rRNA (guanine966-N2)-methyltransferase
MRIVAGELRSRRLRAPRGGTRPSSDRLREALFAALGDVDGADVLDLFAGSGALGLEALSRGAAHATFCEVDPGALAALRANVEALDLAERATIRPLDARRALRADAGRGRRYDLLLVDPPYCALRHFQAALDRFCGRIAVPGALLAVESDATAEPRYAGFELLSRRRAGSSALSIFRRAQEQP